MAHINTPAVATAAYSCGQASARGKDATFPSTFESIDIQNYTHNDKIELINPALRRGNLPNYILLFTFYIYLIKLILESNHDKLTIDH